MDSVVFDKPYVFSPPYRGHFWPILLQRLARWRLRRAFGITEFESRGLEHLQASRQAGHGILLAPNHCRPCDPFVVAELARQAGMLPYTMASAHLFAQGKFQAWVLRHGGVFSIYREGVDRAAVSAAIEILEQAERPLVIFPEGTISRSNDRLNALMEGTAFIARSAAKKRASATPPGQVVIHPVALRYTFRGDLAAAVGPVLDEIERRLTWQPQRQLPLAERVTKVGGALLGLKEMEYMGATQNGTLAERMARLINHLLAPLEQEWLEGKADRTVIGRVKKLRIAILPAMIEGQITEEERARRWRQLADMYLAQQLWCYPPDYLTTERNGDRLLETVERFEEDMKDTARVHPPMKVMAQVGPAIPVSPSRDRGASEDPVMSALESQLQTMLASSS